MRSLLITLLLTLGVTDAVRADDAPAPRPSQADQVRAAVRADDETRLRQLALCDEPCPWHVADALVRLGRYDAALRFARAAPRPDTARLPAWIEAQRAREPSEEIRAAAERAMQADTEAARRAALAALESLVHQGDAFERTLVDVSRGQLLHELGQMQAASEAYLVGGRSAERLGWLRMAADAYEAAGMAAHANMQYDVLLTAWNQLLTVQQGRGDDRGEAVATMFVGGAYFEVGDLPRAMRLFQESRRMFEALGNEDGLAWVLNNLALVHSRRGEYMQERALLEHALQLARKVGNRYRIACVTVDLGTCMDALGERDRALALYTDALSQFTAMDNAAGIAQCQGNIGHLHLALEDWDEAVRWSEHALAGARKIKDSVFICCALNALGWAVMHQGDLERAQRIEQECLDLAHATRDGWSEAHAHQSLAEVLRRRKRFDEAQRNLIESLRIAAQMDSSELEMVAYQGQARIWLDRDDAARAVYASQQALRASLRQLAGLPERLSAQSRAGLRALYALAIEAALDLGKPQALFTAIESTRAGGLLESLENRAVIRDATVPGPLLEAERVARTRVRTAVHRFRTALGQGDLKETRTCRTVLAHCRDDLDHAIERIQAEAKASASVLYPEPATLAELQGELAAEDAYVAYSLLGPRAVALIVTRKDARIVDLGAVETLRETAAVTLDDPDADTGAAVARLRERLVQPLGLKARTRRLLLAPEGALGYVPFALLVGERDVAYVPSATTYRVLRGERTERGRGVLALGDPDYGWKAVAPTTVAQRGGMRLVPLPASGDEARRVGGRAGDVVLVREEATPRRFLQMVATRQRWAAVHLACHGLVDPDQPLRSALALAFEPDGTNLLMCGDIFNLRIPADLAVLSACDTGRGRVVTGEGIVGLTRAFMLAGAPRVLVSLWKVDDAATQALMVEFYRHWRPKGGGPGLDAATALRKAQAHVRGHEAWRHPAYWAAWVLWGLPR